ncbi:alanine racemase [Sulfitobacter sp. F26204]|uniref:alanine racemase n=1 Tax=Sulfitobacter sp. F26204 TaxID=2996014 RepID=UPI00225E0360|nr:alanine racemase [Sulfitobacter sp. F26204]MCX7559471.1 alanine racemase [Sulfitobacter sp. F26204]
MSTATLTIDLPAIAANWETLDRLTSCETAAVVKADAYGLGVAKVGPALARAGARLFFVAAAEEGIQLRRALGHGPAICVFTGHMPGDADIIRAADLTPMVNSVDQLLIHVEALPGHPFGIQFDTGMNRLGMEPAEWSAVHDIAIAQKPELLISHLACADEPDHLANQMQLDCFVDMTEGLDIPRSLAATGGIFLGEKYHFDLTRPGVGLYGGLPFVDARPVVTLDVPVIQVRDVAAGESVGYGAAYVAKSETRVATVAAGYADGVIRAMGAKATFTHEGRKLPVIGRVSMDAITVDVSSLAKVPEHLQLIGLHQSVDTVAEFAGTIGYEILTSLGARYDRVYLR